MKELFISPRGILDLKDIRTFLSQKFPELANLFLDKLYSRCEVLKEMPELGRSREELALGMRSLLFQKYLIFYRIRGERIEVARVLSGYRDVDTLF